MKAGVSSPPSTTRLASGPPHCNPAVPFWHPNSGSKNWRSVGAHSGRAGPLSCSPGTWSPCARSQTGQLRPEGPPQTTTLTEGLASTRPFGALRPRRAHLVPEEGAACSHRNLCWGLWPESQLGDREGLPAVQGEGEHCRGQRGAGWCLASLADSGFPSPPLAPPDILTEDDVYCSCLAKTLCHVPVPVTVGFYAPFGCRLHMMLDKITGEDLRVFGGEGLREMEPWVPAPPQASPRPACP